MCSCHPHQLLDRHVDLGLPDAKENERIHEEALEVSRTTVRNPRIARALVQLCASSGLEVVDVQMHTSVERTFAEFDRVTRAEYYEEKIPGFVELMKKAEANGTLCVLFPFVTVVAAKKRNI